MTSPVREPILSASGLPPADAVKTPFSLGLLSPAHVTLLFPSPPVLSSLQAEWENLLVEEGYYEAPTEVELPPITHHSIIYRMDEPIRLFQEYRGRRDERLAVPGGFSLWPAGIPSHVRWLDPSHVLHVRLDAQWVASLSALMGAARGEPEMRDSFEETDPQIGHVLLALKAELESGCLGGPLYAQHLATALTSYLVGHFSVFPLRLKEYTHGLGKSDLVRVLAYINDCLTEDLSLDELAACVHLSPYHFARLFKQSTGIPPYEYVIRQRVEKSQGLLRSGRLTIGEVAQAVGFSDHSKLDRHFKRLTGLTPLQFRNQ